MLMNAGFVRERVPPHDSLIGLRSERDGGGEQLADGVQVLGIDVGLERKLVLARFDREPSYRFFPFPDPWLGQAHFGRAPWRLFARPFLGP